MRGRTGIGQARGARFVAAWIGLHALLLQLLLPVFHHPEHVFASPAALASALVAMGDAGLLPAAHHPGHGDKDTAPSSCPLCLAVQHATPFVPPTAPALALPRALGTLAFVPETIGSAQWTHVALRARGPPLA